MVYTGPIVVINRGTPIPVPSGILVVPTDVCIAGGYAYVAGFTVQNGLYPLPSVGCVVVINTSTNTISRVFGLPDIPAGITTDGTNLYVCNSGQAGTSSAGLWVVTASTGLVVGSCGSYVEASVEGTLGSHDCALNGNEVWVSVPYLGSIYMFDTTSYAEVTNLTLLDCAPWGLAPGGWVSDMNTPGGHGGVWNVNLSTSIETFLNASAWGGYEGQNICTDSTGETLYVADGFGYVAVISVSLFAFPTMAVLGTLSGVDSPTDIAMALDDSAVYYSDVSTVDWFSAGSTSNNVISTAGLGLTGIAMTSSDAYICDSYNTGEFPGARVYVVSTSSHAVVTSILLVTP